MPQTGSCTHSPLPPAHTNLPPPVRRSLRHRHSLSSLPHFQSFPTTNHDSLSPLASTRLQSAAFFTRGILLLFSFVYFWSYFWTFIRLSYPRGLGGRVRISRNTTTYYYYHQQILPSAFLCLPGCTHFILEEYPFGSATFDLGCFILPFTIFTNYRYTTATMRSVVYLPRPKRSLLLALGATAFVAVKPVFAQDDETTNNPPPPANTNQPPPANTNPPPPADTNVPPPNLPNDDSTNQEPAATTNQPPPPPAETNKDEDPAPTETEEDEPATTSKEDAVITQTGDAEETNVLTDAPRITGGDSAPTGGGFLTDAPTLTRIGIPTYPAASVPPTYHAPFMQHSRAPDGTVFIAVGAILGAFGLGILIWRIIVGLLLHRSVERAALAQHDANSKASFPAPPAPFYKYTDQGSTMSLGAARGNRKSTRGPIPSNNPSASNLFFSPTAAASGNNGNRASAYLPSGFYASGAGNPSQVQSISMTNLRPDSQGRSARDSRITPPDSPAFAARRNMSTTSLNINSPANVRAPSAYLEDLLADDPGALPPPHMLPTSGPRRSPGPQNRF